MPPDSTKVNVALPGERFDASRSVCVIVDVLRASSSIVTMFERGCERVVCGANIDEARRLHEMLSDHLLCGERGGLPPEDFDYGNSPVEFSQLDLTGKSIIHATGNGTKALAAVASDARGVFIGCMLNRRAVAGAALQTAELLGADLTIVAAGDPTASSEDEICARAIADVIEGRPLSKDAEREVLECGHARTLRRLGLGADVDYCARLDVSDVVPGLQPAEPGLLVLRAFKLPTT